MTSDPRRHEDAPLEKGDVAKQANAALADAIVSINVSDKFGQRNFSEKARIEAGAEVLQYIEDLRQHSLERARHDRSDMATTRHVSEAARELREKPSQALANFSDWCKWVGFFFLGAAFQQWNSVRHQKPIVSGSVTWLVADVIVAAGLFLAALKPPRWVGKNKTP